MNSILKKGMVFLSFILMGIPIFGSDFYAYFTRLSKGETFEVSCRTSEFADVVVQLPMGRLVFWRGTSYLPYFEAGGKQWPFEEVIARSGNGTPAMPDARNMFSHVKIVESTPTRVVVLWRYLPSFAMNEFPHYPTHAEANEFVEEIFTIEANGHVHRMVRPGTQTIEEWNAYSNAIEHIYSLSDKGVKNLITKPQRASISRLAIQGNPVKRPSSRAPVLEFSFDEGLGATTSEQRTGAKCFIKGYEALWKKGISGTALQFDGYTSLVEFPSSGLPAFNKGITVESWIAAGAYPWNWVPIVQQGDSLGYALGLDSKGYATFRVFADGKTYSVTSERTLNRNRWYHIAGVLDPENQLLHLFVNGFVSSSIRLPSTFTSITTDGSNLRMGMAGVKSLASDPVRPWFNFPTTFTFDGLIDEVRVYDAPLTQEQLLPNFKEMDPGESIRFLPDMQHRELPKIASTDSFAARYTNLKYYDTWDNMWRFGDYADVVVEFDQSPSKFVFWKGTNYVPCIVNDRKQWYSNEFNETWGTGGGAGCQEPMSDKKLLTAHARIVEQSPARVVVHWRVALLDTKLNIQANYDTLSQWGDWSDWFYYIYPDGVAAKRMRLWTSGEMNHEWQESMAIIGENTRPEEVLEQNPVYYFISDSGAVTHYNWRDAFKAEVDYANSRVFVVNYKSDWKPFTIGNFTGGNVFRGEEITPYSVFCNWNHWPTARINSDGRFSSHPDRASHTSLNNLFLDIAHQSNGPAPFYEKLLLEGMSNLSPDELYALSRSWLNHPAIEPLHGLSEAGYEMAQRAYVMRKNGSSIRFRIDASTENPLVNVAVVVYGWDTNSLADIEVDGFHYSGDKLIRQGIVRDHNGERALVIWMEGIANTTVSFDVKQTEINR